MRLFATMAIVGALALPTLGFAASVTVVATGIDAINEVDATTSVTLPAGATWDTAPTTLAGNQTGAASPFSLLGTGNFETIEYFAVGPAHATNEAVLKFSGVQKSLSLLWGSMDGLGANSTGDRISFWKDNVQQDAFIAWETKAKTGQSGLTTILDGSAGPTTFPLNGFGGPYTFVMFDDVTFDEVRFAANENAFEFANVSAAPIPLPLTAPLLLVALGALGVIKGGRRAA